MRIMIMKKLFLVMIALVVLILATGGDFARQMLENKARIAMESSDEKSDDANVPLDQVISSNIFYSVVHISHIIFHSDLISEFELPEIDETKAHSVINTALNFTKHYRTLFQIIISPNAP